jgi:hypothetical protein
MLRFYTSGSVFSIFTMPILIVVYVFMNVQTGYFDDNQTLDIGFWGSYPIQNKYISLYASGLLVFLNSYLLNRLFNLNNFSDKNTSIVSLLYVILMSFYHTFYYLDGVIIAHSFIILCIYQLYKLETNIDGRKDVFNAGFIFGIAVSFHPPIVFSVPILWLMITRIRPFVFREILLSLTGIVTPLLYGIVWLIYNKREVNWNLLDSTISYTQKDLVFFVFISVNLFISIIGIIGIRMKQQKSSIRFRKLANILYLLWISGLLIGGFQYAFFTQYEWFSFSVIGLSMVLSFSFFHKKLTFISTFVILLLVIFSFVKFYL